MWFFSMKWNFLESNEMTWLQLRGNICLILKNVSLFNKISQNTQNYGKWEIIFGRVFSFVVCSVDEEFGCIDRRKALSFGRAQH